MREKWIRWLKLWIGWSFHIMIPFSQNIFFCFCLFFQAVDVGWRCCELSDLEKTPREGSQAEEGFIHWEGDSGQEMWVYLIGLDVQVLSTCICVGSMALLILGGVSWIGRTHPHTHTVWGGRNQTEWRHLFTCDDHLSDCPQCSSK